jgi:hypothetical protein
MTPLPPFDPNRIKFSPLPVVRTDLAPVPVDTRQVQPETGSYRIDFGLPNDPNTSSFFQDTLGFINGSGTITPTTRELVGPNNSTIYQTTGASNGGSLSADQIAAIKADPNAVRQLLPTRVIVTDSSAADGNGGPLSQGLFNGSLTGRQEGDQTILVNGNGQEVGRLTGYTDRTNITDTEGNVIPRFLDDAQISNIEDNGKQLKITMVIDTSVEDLPSDANDSDANLPGSSNVNGPNTFGKDGRDIAQKQTITVVIDKAEFEKLFAGRYKLRQEEVPTGYTETQLSSIRFDGYTDKDRNLVAPQGMRVPHFYNTSMTDFTEITEKPDPKTLDVGEIEVSQPNVPGTSTVTY